MSNEDFEFDPQARLQASRERLERVRREHERQKRIWTAAAGGLLLLLVIVLVLVIGGKKPKEQEPADGPDPQETITLQPEETPDVPDAPAGEEVPGQEPEETALPAMTTSILYAVSDEKTRGFSDEVISTNGLLIDIEEERILAQKDPRARINPASMTKILTVLVAAEQITDWTGSYTMTREIADYCFVKDCSVAGFEVDEEIPLIDLFYGTALPSGADAALGLACYVAGSQEAFVELMNQKLEDLGLSETSHFTNCVGLYDENHYSTCYDIAVILKAAADNEFARKILSAHTYVTTPTEIHPEGISISNLFLRRIEDYDTNGEVLMAKTGYVVQSKSCAASLAKDRDGREYICVTVGSSSAWRCIFDQIELYQKNLPKSE